MLLEAGPDYADIDDLPEEVKYNGYASATDIAPDTMSLGPLPLNNPKGICWSTNLGYLGLSRHRLNLTIRLNCLVHRNAFEGNRATCVDVDSSGERFVVEGDEIILSAGAVGSPQILMLSGVGPANHLADIGISVVK